jgi:acyl carrier protein
MALRDELRALIAEIGELDDPAAITDEADLFRDLGLDSMQALEIVLEMERRYDIKVNEESLRKIRTLADAMRLAQSLGVPA